MAYTREQILDKLMNDTNSLLSKLCESYSILSDEKLDTSVASMINENLRAIKQLKMIIKRN